MNPYSVHAASYLYDLRVVRSLLEETLAQQPDLFGRLSDPVSQSHGMIQKIIDDIEFRSVNDART